MAASRPKTTVQKLARRVNSLQTQVTKQMREGWEEVLHRLPPEWRKAVKRLLAEVDHTSTAWMRRAERLVNTARKRLERMAARAEKQVTGAVEPISRRFDLPSRMEVDRLRRRIDQLERRMRVRPAAVVA